MPVGFSYAMIEAALVELHGIAPDDVPALRSRYGVFQRGGLLGKQPGRGARLQYEADQLHRVVLAFELTQMGVSPTTVLWLIQNHWDKRLRDIFMKAGRALVRETSDMVLILIGLTAMDGPEQSVPSISHTTMDRLAATLSLAIRGKDELHDPPARALVLNVSAQLSRFHKALAAYHLSPAMLAGLADEDKNKRADKPKQRAKNRSR